MPRSRVELLMGLAFDATCSRVELLQEHTLPLDHPPCASMCYVDQRHAVLIRSVSDGRKMSLNHRRRLPRQATDPGSGATPPARCIRRRSRCGKSACRSLRVVVATARVENHSTRRTARFATVLLACRRERPPDGQMALCMSLSGGNRRVTQHTWGGQSCRRPPRVSQRETA